VSQYQKSKTNLDFTEARDSEWQWHQLGHMQVCTLLQTDNHANTSPLSFLQAGCPSCRLTNSVKAQYTQQYPNNVHIVTYYADKFRGKSNNVPSRLALIDTQCSYSMSTAWQLNVRRQAA